MDQKFIAKTEISINAPISNVWDGLTNPDTIKKYFFGTQVITDWQVGSPIIYKGEWKGTTYEDKGVILQNVRGKLLVSTYWSSMSGLPDKSENYKTVKYELSGANGSTKLTLTQDNNNTPEEADHSENNWNMVLGKLKELLES